MPGPSKHFVTNNHGVKLHKFTHGTPFTTNGPSISAPLDLCFKTWGVRSEHYIGGQNSD
jgi:hypothetical protein